MSIGREYYDEEGIRTKIGGCMSTFEKHYDAIIPTKR